MLSRTDLVVLVHHKGRKGREASNESNRTASRETSLIRDPSVNAIKKRQKAKFDL